MTCAQAYTLSVTLSRPPVVAAAYQALLDRVEAIEGIQQGLADVKAGRTKPARQVFARLLTDERGRIQR